MSKYDKQRLFLKLSTLAILAVCLGFLLNNVGYALFASSRRVQGPTAVAQTPTVAVQPQSDAPLSISSAMVEAVNPLEPQLTFSVANVSKKPINAYAIRHIALFGRATSEGVMVRNSDSISAVLQPGQSETEYLTGNVYPEPVQRINLVVDFVEFTDGTTWGSDKFKSAERLAGQRAGAQAEAERLVSIEQARGSSALVSALSADSVNIAPPSGHAPEWENGFREGINFKRARLKRANSQGGLTEINLELRRPFDASERRQQ